MNGMQNYADLQPIGQGQYGTAYKARHRLDGQLYCIKRIPMTAKDDHAGALKEVQLLAQLDHPNIIAYKESFVDQEGGLCIVTSFCEEGDLFHRIRSRAKAKEYFSENEVMDMFVQIASALMFIHSKRILHRDLKTQNIFIARGNIIKLGDFGISKVLEKTDQFATTVTGTPYYMAPEICTNQPYTFKSDIWSLGCVLYELCTLKHAFAADSLLSLVFQIVRGTFPPISTDDYSKNLSQLVNMLLNRDVAQRPSLAQIFQLPYVSDNLHRYRTEFKQHILKQSSTMVKRKQMQERAANSFKAEGAQEEGTAHLTPKERLRRNKEQQMQRREMELRLAAMDTQGDRAKAAQRKAHIVHGSNTGLPGSRPAAVQDNDASMQIPTPSRTDERSQFARDASSTGDMAGSFVNMDTMPAGGYTHMGDTLPSAMVASQRQQQQQQPQPPRTPSLYETRENTPIRPASSAANGTRQYGKDAISLYETHENTPVRPASSAANGTRQYGRDASRLGQQGRGWPPPDDDEGGQGQLDGDSVLMGTVGPMGDTMVNMGTMAMGVTGKGQTAYFPEYGPMAGTMPPLPRTNSLYAQAATSKAAQPQAPAAAAAPAAAGGTAAQPRAPSARAAPPAAPPPVKAVHAPSPRAVSPSPPSRAPGVNQGSFGKISKSPSMDYSSGFEEDADESPYESDFEDVEDQDTINQKCKLLSNIEDLERTHQSNAYGDTRAISQVCERVGLSTKTGKAAALRERCQQSLGRMFPEVYAYLRKMRTQESLDESQIQRALQELVGRDSEMLKGCFLVDQLVFQETCHQLF